MQITDFSRFCVNRHHIKTMNGCTYCGRGSIWGNPFRTTHAGGQYKQGEAVAAHEFWLAQPEQAWLLKQIDTLANQPLVCYCAPKLCHTNTLAYLANSNRNSRIAWWRTMRSRTEPRKISSHEDWLIFNKTA